MIVSGLSRIVSAAVCLASAFAVLLPAQTHAEEEIAYIFSYFQKNGEDGLHLHYSLDGFNWSQISGGQSIYNAQVGSEKLMRDPCIIQGPEGDFHMVWTTGWKGREIGYARSSDLLNWSEPLVIPLFADEPNTKNCWAPELFYDAANERYLIFWSSRRPGVYDGTGHRVNYTTTEDFESFTPAEVFFDPGYTSIDSTLLRDQATGRYVMFFKDERWTKDIDEPGVHGKSIRMAFSEHAAGPWTVEPKILTSDDFFAEGPTACKINDQYVVYFDKHDKGEMGAVASQDLETWTDVSAKLSFPNHTRHGTILPVSRSTLDALLEATKQLP